jgi:hypothetical protein
MVLLESLAKEYSPLSCIILGQSRIAWPKPYTDGIEMSLVRPEEEAPFVAGNATRRFAAALSCRVLLGAEDTVGCDTAASLEAEWDDKV